MKTTNINEIVNVLQSNNLPVRIPTRKRLLSGEYEFLPAGYSYNCWGFTAFYHKWIEEAYWMYDENMRELLSKNSVSVETPDLGDIAVFEKYSEWTECVVLHHTAIILPKHLDGEQMILHKPGACPLELSTLAAASQLYHCTPTFRKPIDNATLATI